MPSRTALLVFLGALLVLHPAVEAATVSVPPTVLNGQVPFHVTGVPAGATVTATINGITVTAIAAGSTVGLLHPGAPNGFQSWTVVVTPAGSPADPAITGSVYVDNSLQQVAQAIALLRANVTAVTQAAQGATLGATRALAGNVTSLEDAVARLESLVNGTASTIDGLQARIGVLQLEATSTGQRVQALESQQGDVASSASAAESSASVGLLVLAAVALLLVLASLWLGYDAHRRHQELMVLVLAFAGKAGLGPDSPELQRALAIVQGEGASS